MKDFENLEKLLGKGGKTLEVGKQIAR